MLNLRKTMAAGVPLSCTLLHCLLSLALASYSYDAFREKHGRAEIHSDPVSYNTRRDVFRQRRAEVLLHNAQPLSWKVELNRFSDYTNAELRGMLGYKRDAGSRWSSGGSQSASSFIQEHEYGIRDYDQLAAEVDWRQSLMKSSDWVRNQGACGSCWAVAAVGALEMHAEKAHNGSAQKLSYQQLVDCVPNPRHCGGTGGCKGATGELAFEFGRLNGLSADQEYQTSDGGKCNAKVPSALKVSSFTRLPENKGSYLKHALATKGPVVVSADGGSWFAYKSGVFSGCEKDTVVNHAVLAVGYGNDPASTKDYWTLRNSWGGDWGEHGFMRIERHKSDDAYCGIDNKPKDGVYCDGAPDSVTVCGMCGITSDSAYPTIGESKSVANLKNVRSLRASEVL